MLLSWWIVVYFVIVLLFYGVKNVDFIFVYIRWCKGGCVIKFFKDNGLVCRFFIF